MNSPSQAYDSCLLVFVTNRSTKNIRPPSISLTYFVPVSRLSRARAPCALCADGQEVQAQ